MATLSSSGFSGNFDDSSVFSGLVGGDTIQLTGGSSLVMNSDVNFSQKGNISFLYALSTSNSGGNLLIDGRDVWWIPFDASTGNVPTLTTLNSNGVSGGTSLATGELLGVWTAIGVAAPSTGGGAMPTTGFIKLRYKSGDFLDNEVITLPGGATVTVNSSTGGQRGWIHWRLRDGSYMYGNTLASIEVQGDWFELGTTNGTNGQTFQYYLPARCPAIWVETGVGTNEYMRWVDVGTNRAAESNRHGGATTADRHLFLSNTSGVITIAGLGSGTEGYLPPSGCRVRVPNVTLIGSASPFTAPSVNTGVTSRPGFSGAFNKFKINKCLMPIFFDLNGSNEVDLNYVGIYDEFRVYDNLTRKVYYDNVVLGLLVGANVANRIQAYGSPYGYDMVDCTFLNYQTFSTQTFINFSNTNNISMTRVKLMSYSNGTGATLTNTVADYRMLNLTQSSNITLTDCELWGGYIYSAGATNGIISNLKFYDRIENVTMDTSTVSYPIELMNNSNNWTISNISFPEFDKHARGGLAFLNRCYDITIKDCGTFASPLCQSVSTTLPMLAFVRYNQAGANIVIKRCHTRNSTNLFYGSSKSDGLVIQDCSVDTGDTTSNTGQNVLINNVQSGGVSASNGAILAGNRFFCLTGSSPNIYLFFSPNTSTYGGLSTNSTSPVYAGNFAYPSAAGDYFEVEMPIAARGIIGPTGTPTLTKDFSGSTTTFEYAIDTGSGFGSYKTANNANWTAESFPVDYSGVRLKVKATFTALSGTVGASYVAMATFPVTVNDTSRAVFEADPGIPIEFTGLVAGSEIRMYTGVDPATAVEVDGVESSGSTASLSHSNTGESGYVQIFALGYLPVRFDITYQATAQSYLIQQSIDRQYSNPT